MAEEPLAAAIAERLGPGSHDSLYSQVLAAAVAGAVRVAGRHWLGTTGPPSFAAVLRDALRPVLADQGSVTG